jgi:iron-sulfur cluster assembly protein
MITLTDKAAEKISEQLRGRGGMGLRIIITTTGCSGYAYHLEWADRINEEDVVFRDKDIELVIDKKWSTMLIGATLDYVKKGLNEGFEFVNPNEKARCGCGESFTV